MHFTSTPEETITSLFKWFFDGSTITTGIYDFDDGLRILCGPCF